MFLFGEGYSGTFPRNHARIGYDNAVPSSTVAASTSEAGFPATATQNQLTYELWRPTAVPATLTYTFDAQPIGYVGIAAHNLGEVGAAVSIEYQQGGSWYPLVFEVPQDIGATLSLDFAAQTYQVYQQISDTGAVFYQFNEVNCTGIRINLTGAIASIGVVYAGRVLEMYRPFYSGHTPGTLARKTTIRPNKSVNGQWLGRSVLREGLNGQFNWNNTPLPWYETNVEPFSQAAINAPFFIAWNPKQHPDHVLYAWTSEDIAPTLSGVRNLCEFGFSAEGVE